MSEAEEKISENGIPQKLGVILLHSACFAGMVLLAFVLFLFIWSAVSFFGGWDSSDAFMLLFLAIPFVPVPIILFLGGFVLARRCNKKALKLGAVGFFIAVTVLPVAYAFLLILLRICYWWGM